MSEASPCPYCGCPQPDEATPVREQRPSGAYARAMDALCREVERIREIAETREVNADTRRVEELTLEVNHLRETVARLRGGSSNPWADYARERLPHPA